jgi:alkanesulfonate monooxygenase SsuD/methylene tetrahydromethanopterin reductase-like flavin-dependent oxidoreductase (luciferase family)
MPMAITDNPEDGERLVRGLMQRFRLSEERSRDTVLAGSVAQIQDKLGRLQATGVDQLYIPTFLPPWNLEQLDRFMTEVAPAFR